MRLLAAGLGLATALAAPGASLAAPIIRSEAHGFSGYYEDISQATLEEESADDDSAVAGERVSAEILFCPGPGLCAVQPGEPPNVAAYAETDYGTNRAYARADVQSLYGSGDVRRYDEAYAVSRWSDDWDLGGSVFGPRTFDIKFQIDGTWDNFAEFSLLVLVVDPVLGTDILDSGLPRGLVGLGLVTNCGAGNGSVGCSYPGSITPPPVPIPMPFRTFVQVNPNGDADGSFDETFVVSAPYVAGRTYEVTAALSASTAAFEFSKLDADSTARVTQVLLPEGGSITSAAGALANYHVTTVPEPGTALLLAGGLAALATRRRVEAGTQPR